MRGTGVGRAVFRERVSIRSKSNGSSKLTLRGPLRMGTVASYRLLGIPRSKLPPLNERQKLGRRTSSSGYMGNLPPVLGRARAAPRIVREETEFAWRSLLDVRLEHPRALEP